MAKHPPFGGKESRAEEIKESKSSKKSGKAGKAKDGKAAFFGARKGGK